MRYRKRGVYMLKKWSFLLLCILLAMSLCACAGEAETVQDPQMVQQQEALASADAFLEAGDHEGAIAVLESLDIYHQISERLAEAEKGRQEQQLADLDWLLGKTWYALGKDMQITFRREMNQNGELTAEYRILVNEQGTFTERKGEIPCTVRDGLCSLRFFTDFEHILLTDVPVSGYQKDGIVVLDLGGMEFVPEDHARISGMETVEITMDNWQEYFEIKTAETWQKDDFGQIANLEIVTYVALKEAYLDRVDLENSDVTVGYRYGWDLMNCTLDLEEPSYKFNGVKSSYGEQDETFVLPQRLGDYRGDYPDYLGGGYYGGYDFIIRVIGVATNYRITRIAGTLALR